MSEYTYKLTDTKNSSVDRYKLWDEVEAAIASPSLENISLLDDGFVVIFSTALTIPQNETLTSVVSSHEANNVNSLGLVKVSETVPFARPDYRTKRDANTSWETCAEDSATIIDFAVTEERYVTGGEVIYKDAKEGDYVTAEVYDKDNVIPEPYRAALCEDHPSVAKYIVKKWLRPTGLGEYGSFLIDTYPLNAKISAGLYLRVTYHASSETGNRKAAVNYHLTKSLL